MATDEKVVTVPDDMTDDDVKKEFEAEYYETEVISVQKVG
jgi:hypothetical protein